MLAACGAPDVIARPPRDPDPAALTWIGRRDVVYNRLMLTDHDPTARVQHCVDRLVDVHSMARAGLGVAVLGRFFADPDPGLCRVNGEPIVSAAMELWIPTHRCGAPRAPAPSRASSPMRSWPIATCSRDGGPRHSPAWSALQEHERDGDAGGTAQALA